MMPGELPGAIVPGEVPPTMVSPVSVPLPVSWLPPLIRVVLLSSMPVDAPA